MKPRSTKRPSLPAMPPIPIHAARSLICAMVQQAIADYRRFERSRLIVKGRVNPDWRGYRVGVFAQRQAAAKDLLHFFRLGGVMEEWLELAGVNISGAQIRRHLGIV